MNARVQPGDTTTQLFHRKATPPQVNFIDICDLQFPARRWHQSSRDIQDCIVVKIKTRHGVIGSWLERLFLERYGAASTIELHHTIALRILNQITEHQCAIGKRRGLSERCGKPLTEKDIVAQNEANTVAADEIPPNDEG